MGMAEHREPYDARVSRTVLGARGGETPPRDSPNVPDDRRPEALALAGGRSGWGCARRSRPEAAGQTGRQAPAPQAAEAADPCASCHDHGQAGQLQRRERRGDALGRAPEAQGFKQQSGEFPSADAPARTADEAVQVSWPGPTLPLRHDGINNLFHLRRDHRPVSQYRAARTQAFQTWAAVTGV